LRHGAAFYSYSYDRRMKSTIDGGAGANNPRSGKKFGNVGPWIEALEPGQKMQVRFIETNFETVFSQKFQTDKRQIRCIIVSHPHPDNPPKFEGVFETTCAGAIELQADVIAVGDSLDGQLWNVERFEYGTEITAA